METSPGEELHLWIGATQMGWGWLSYLVCGTYMRWMHTSEDTNGCCVCSLMCCFCVWGCGFWA